MIKINGRIFWRIAICARFFHYQQVSITIYKLAYILVSILIDACASDCFYINVFFFFGCCFETISEYCIDSNEKDVQTQSKIFHISFWNRLSNDSRNDQKIAFFVLLDYFSDDWPLSNTFLKNIQHEQTKKFGSKKKPVYRSKAVKQTILLQLNLHLELEHG